jgi:hypothetical protein
MEGKDSGKKPEDS